MNEKTLDFIEQLAILVNKTGADIIAEYTVWYQLNAFIWIFFGAFFMISAFKCPSPEGWEDEISQILRAAAFIVGLIIICVNITNVFAPGAYAIHTLLTDIRG